MFLSRFTLFSLWGSTQIAPHHATWFADSVVSRYIWMTSCLQTLIISYICTELSSASTSTSRQTVQYSKLRIKASNLDVLSEYQFTDDDVQSPKAKCEIQWVYGFQYLSIHSPPEPLKPAKIKTFLSQVLHQQRQFCVCSFVCSWELLCLTPEALWKWPSWNKITDTGLVPPGGLVWESSCLCWRGWQDLGLGSLQIEWLVSWSAHFSKLIQHLGLLRGSIKREWQFFSVLNCFCVRPEGLFCRPCDVWSILSQNGYELFSVCSGKLFKMWFKCSICCDFI